MRYSRKGKILNDAPAGEYPTDEDSPDRVYVNGNGEKNELVLLMARLADEYGFPFRFNPPDVALQPRSSDGFYGIPRLDRKSIGNFTSDLIGLASFGGANARAKEDFLLHIVLHHAVDREENVLFFSLRMKAADVWRRLLKLLSGYDPAFVDGSSAEELDRLWNAYFMLLRARLTVIDAQETDAEALECRLKNARPDFIAVDDLQRFNPIPELEDQRERVQYAHIVYSLKQLAKEYGAPILLTAQLPLPPGSTPGQQPEPTLRDFDRTVSNADFDMLLLVRAERGEEIAEASLVKNRHGDCAAAHFEFAG
jgi:replicative DNA helicase